MKKTLLLLAAVATTASAFAQGTIGFSNFGVEISRKDINGTVSPAGAAGVSLVLSLYLADNLNTPIATTTFFPDTGFFVAPDNDVVVPGHAPKSTDASFIVRGYEAGKTYDTSTWQGQSAAFTAGPLGGPDPNGGTPQQSPLIDNLQAFQIVQTPEPATIALGAVGIGALLLRRRSK